MAQPAELKVFLLAIHTNRNVTEQATSKKYKNTNSKKEKRQKMEK